MRISYPDEVATYGKCQSLPSDDVATVEKYNLLKVNIRRRISVSVFASQPN